MEAFLIKTATISPTGERVEANALPKKTADGFPDEIEISTWTVPLETRPPQHRNERTSEVVVVIPVWMMGNVAREDSGASFG